jgi:iron complex transport system substrate-binding protein
MAARRGVRQVSEQQNGLRQLGGQQATDRRSFIQILGSGALLALASPVISSCESVTSVLDAALEGTRKVVDDAGREVVIPTAGNIKRIFFSAAAGQIFCFTMTPDLLCGTGLKFTPQELEYLPASAKDLPYLGTVSGGEVINREMLLRADVQLIFAISGAEATALTTDEAEKLQKQTGIPCLWLDGSYERVAECYRFIGDVLGLKDRAEELAAYYEDVTKRVGAAVASVSDADRVRLYYAEGPDGLQTEPSSSAHAFTFKFAGANNVAAVPDGGAVGMSNVSMEQVLAWNPDVIIAWSRAIRGGADEEIRANKLWKDLKAVRNGRVYTMPNAPFAWCDRPPSVNRILGVQWVANMLYPKLYDVDMVEVVKDFYQKFYWVAVSNEQALELLGNSYPAYQG